MGKVIDTHLLRVDEFDLFWPKMQEELLKISSMWSLHWTLESIYENTMNEYMQCWGSGWDSAIRVFLFTRVASFPANRILQTILLFGNSIEECWPSLTATVESFALAEGCTAIEIRGRRGWRILLKKEHCIEQGTTYTKSLERGRMQ